MLQSGKTAFQRVGPLPLPLPAIFCCQHTFQQQTPNTVCSVGCFSSVRLTVNCLEHQLLGLSHWCHKLSKTVTVIARSLFCLFNGQQKVEVVATLQLVHLEELVENAKADVQAWYCHLHNARQEVQLAYGYVYNYTVTNNPDQNQHGHHWKIW